MVDCEGLKTINNLYTAVKISAHMVKEGVGVKASPIHADADAAVARHAEAAGALAIHAGAGVAAASHAGPAAEAHHASAAAGVAGAGAKHAPAAGAVAKHADAARASSDRGSDGEYRVGAGAVRGASEQRLSTRVCAVVPTNEDGGVVCHLRSPLPLGCVLLAGFSLA